MGDEHLGGAGEPDATPVALDDRLADLALERGELLGDRGRREMERVGGRRERAVLGDLAQDAQAAGAAISAIAVANPATRTVPTTPSA